MIRKIASLGLVWLAGLLLAPLALASPSFDCRKAEFPDEIAICASQRLSQLDVLVSQAYKHVRAARGDAFARSIGRPLLNSRRNCQADEKCIEDIQRASLRVYQELGAPPVDLSGFETPQLANASVLPGEQIMFGSRCGMGADIRAKDGIGTQEARIKFKLTLENAREHCICYSDDSSEQCAADMLREFEPRLMGAVDANCVSGTFTDPYGNKMQFLGKNQNADAGQPDFLFRDLQTNEIADGSSASGYFTYLDTFGRLCPDLVRQ